MMMKTRIHHPLSWMILNPNLSHHRDIPLLLSAFASRASPVSDDVFVADALLVDAAADAAADFDSVEAPAAEETVGIADVVHGCVVVVVVAALDFAAGLMSL